MQRKTLYRLAAAGLLLCLGAVTAVYFIVRQQVNLAPVTSRSGLATITLPAGFSIQVFARGMNGPRFMAFAPNGILYVADRSSGRILALPDANRDGLADSISVFAEGLDAPHSLVFHEDAWYVGVPTGVIRLEDTDGDGQSDRRTTLIDTFTPPGQHSTRTIIFLPDGRLALAAGSTCNVCQESDRRRAAITVYDNPTGLAQLTGERVLATGLRNAVGLAIHPDTGELWATNNGRDLMGDNLPPDTVEIVRDGANYGWPTCHSGDIVDPDMGFAGACDGVPPPVAKLQAHSAPLGLVFYTGDAFPQAYRGDLFIALHGSWNRSVPTGYKIVRLPLNGSTPAGPVEDFATGWLNADGSANGRPVGLAVGPDGALYVSDDKAGFIYRISGQ